MLTTGIGGAARIAAGGRSSLAVLEGGTVEAWGENSYGQLGDGTVNERLAPVTLCGLTGVSAVATRGAHTLSFGGAIAPCPRVTKIAPTAGPPAGGTSVTITGTDLSEATAVRFGSVAAASFTVESPTSITAVSPAGSGSVDVTVSTPAGTSRATPGDLFAYIPAPSVTSVAPSTGEGGGRAPVTILGPTSRASPP